MKNKFLNKKISILILISLCIAILGEICIFNYGALRGNNKAEHLDVLTTSNVKKIKDGYKTTNEEAIIVLNGKGNYIYELQFQYESVHDFDWEMVIKTHDGTEKSTYNRSADIIHLANRQVGENVQSITLKIKAKGVLLSHFQTNNEFDINGIRMLYLFVSSFLVLYLFINRKKLFKKLEITFLLICLPMGVLLILLTPISAYTCNDDQVHFHRAYILFDGKSSQWTASARYYDKLILDAPQRFHTSEEYSEYIKFLNENNSSSTVVSRINEDSNMTYNEWVYIPQAIGLKLGRILNIPFSYTMYLAKLINLLLYAVLVFFSIKIAPILKKTIFVLALMPTPMYLATQFSYDPTITGACLLAFSYFLKMLYAKKIEAMDYFKFCLGISWACLPKAVYCPLFLLGLLLPKEKFKDEKQSTRVKLISICLCFLFASTYVLPVLLGSVEGDVRVAGTSVSGQLKYILTNPITFCKTFAIYTWNNLSYFFFGYKTFSQMGYLVRNTSDYFLLPIFVSVALLFYVTFSEKIDKTKFTPKLKWFFGILLAIIWCLIGAALYMSWTPVGLPEIRGVQGRYFLPVLMLLLVILNPTTKKAEKEERNDWLIVLIPLLVLIFNLLYIIMLLYR